MLWVLMLPWLPPALRPHQPTPRPALANLEPWHYSVVRFEWDALRYGASRSGSRAFHRLSVSARLDLIRDYLEVEAQRQALERRLRQLEENPDGSMPSHWDATQRHRDQLVAYQTRNRALLEHAIQWLIREELAAAGITSITRTFPPVQFQIIEPPLLLTFSPRHEIQSIRFAYLSADTPWAEIERYEDFVLSDFDLSAHVTRVGGVATYPTTVLSEFVRLEFLLDVVAHEWSHTYLLFQPLGVRYFSSIPLRTLNETVATLFGREIARRIMLRHFRDLIPEPSPPAPTSEETEEDSFDFRDAMHRTRVGTDELLAAGRVVEAERYMERRRRFINAQGYRLRKLNQAYFAFHGTYATSPSSSSPIGPKLTELRALSPDLASFMDVARRFRRVSDLDAALQHARQRDPEAAARYAESVRDAPTAP